MRQDPIKSYFRVKKPCTNCPFRKEGAIELKPGRLEGIILSLMEDDSTSFPCHKTVHCKNGGEWTEDGEYLSSGNEAMCAGAAIYLLKSNRPSIGMRLAFVTGDLKPDSFNSFFDLVIDPLEASLDLAK